jgi:DNA-binding NtrC family response regulator
MNAQLLRVGSVMPAVRHPSVSLPQVHALILDDNDFSRARLHQALRVMGVMHVTELISKGTAKGLPSVRSVNIVISDLELALGNGLALLKAIRLARVTGVRPDVPVIFVTDHAYAPTIAAAGKLDASGFVLKPVQAERLRNVMVRALSRRLTLVPDKYEKVDVFTPMRPPQLPPAHLIQ